MRTPAKERISGLQNDKSRLNLTFEYFLFHKIKIFNDEDVCHVSAKMSTNFFCNGSVVVCSNLFGNPS